MIARETAIYQLTVKRKLPQVYSLFLLKSKSKFVRSEHAFPFEILFRSVVESEIKRDQTVFTVLNGEIIHLDGLNLMHTLI